MQGLLCNMDTPRAAGTNHLLARGRVEKDVKRQIAGCIAASYQHSRSFEERRIHCSDTDWTAGLNASSWQLSRSGQSRCGYLTGKMKRLCDYWSSNSLLEEHSLYIHSNNSSYESQLKFVRARNNVFTYFQKHSLTLNKSDLRIKTKWSNKIAWCFVILENRPLEKHKNKRTIHRMRPTCCIWRSPK